MKTAIDNLTDEQLIQMGEDFRSSTPFNHIVIDNFLSKEDAQIIASEFPKFDDEFWYAYENPLEIKKASNNWNMFQAKTYQFFTHVLSPEFTRKVELIVSGNSNSNMYADVGLHGGGFHTHKSGGKLNPHLDYSIHPKLNMQRVANLIVYINPEWKAEYGGSFGLWEHDESTDRPKIDPSKVVDCLFNRAVIFNTTQNSWHGICNAINAPEGLTRNSLATYYLMPPANGADERMKVKFAPTAEQLGDDSIEKLIEERQSISTFSKVYRNKK